MTNFAAFAALAAAAAAGMAHPPQSAEPPAAEAPAAAETIEALATQLEDNFVFPEIGARYAAALRAKGAAGYAGLSGAALAEALTADLRAVHPDRHLRVFPPSAEEPGPRRAGGPPPAFRAIAESGWVADGVAYIDFAGFPGDPETVAAVERFLADHAGARALIVDIRGHRGGGLAEMDALFAELFAAETELVRMDTRKAVEERHGSPVSDGPTLRRIEAPETIVRRAHYAVPAEAPSPWRDVPVYLLTSSRSASAAEHFALSLKRTGRAVLVGETTRGAGHYGGRAGLPGGYSAFIPVGRTWDPDTGEGWEGTGVAPHVPVAADEALGEALRRLGVDPAAPRTVARAR